MRESFVAALRKVHLVADPAHRALGGVACLHLVRGVETPSSFRHLFWVENPYPSVAHLVVLLPDSAQYLDLRKPFEELGRMRSIESLEKPNAIGAYRLEVSCPGLLALWQPLVLDAPTVTLEPLRICVLREPLWSRARQSVEGGSHRLRGSLPFAKDAQSTQHMSRVGALAAPHLEVAAILAPLEQPLQEQPLLAAFQKPRTELRDSTEKLKPGSLRLRPRAYFQSIRARTASAACLSESPSENCITATKANLQGAMAGRPRTSKSSEKSSSA